MGYFKIVTTTLQLDTSINNANIKQSSGGGKSSVTIGAVDESKRIKNHNEGVRIIDHGLPSGGSGGGFLGKRFNRK